MDIFVSLEPGEVRRTKQTVAIDFVNETIGQIRSKFVTVIPAQDMIYQNKEAEAKAYLADADPDILDYPFIGAEVGITAPTAYEVAQTYVNMAYVLRVQASGLEHIRLSTIAAIEAASDKAAVDVAMLAFQAALAA